MNLKKRIFGSQCGSLSKRLSIVWMGVMVGLCFHVAWAQHLPEAGLSLLFIGGGVESVALGGAYATEIDALDGLAENPIKRPWMISPEVSFSYMGLSRELRSAVLSYSQPTSYGVISFVYQNASYRDAASLASMNDWLLLQNSTQLNVIRMVFSKVISSRYMFGVDLNTEQFSKHFGTSSSHFSNVQRLGVHAGANLVMTQDMLRLGTIDIEAIRYSIQLRRFGLSPGYFLSEGNAVQRVVVHSPEVRLGVSADMYEVEWNDTLLSLRGYIDGAVYPWLLAVGVYAGLRAGYAIQWSWLEAVDLNLGGFIGSERAPSTHLGPVAGGVNVHLAVGKQKVALKYALLMENVGVQRGAYHALSFLVGFSARDQEGPRIDLGSFSERDVEEENDIIEEGDLLD